MIASYNVYCVIIRYYCARPRSNNPYIKETLEIVVLSLQLPEKKNYFKNTFSANLLPTIAKMNKLLLFAYKWKITVTLTNQGNMINFKTTQYTLTL